MPGKTVPRRKFLQWTALTATGVLAAACQPQVVEKVVKETVLVKEEVEKVVKETVVVAAATGGSSLEGEIVVWVYPATEDDLVMRYNPLMARTVEDYPNLKAEIEVLPWGGRREKLYAAFAANEAPDVWQSNTDTVPAYIQKGVAMDLTDVLGPEILGMYSEAALSAGTYKGQLAMILTGAGSSGIAYNRTLMEEIGIDPEVGVKTWDEILALAETAKGKGYYATQISTISWDSWLLHVRRAGGMAISEDGTKVQMTEQPAIDALNFYVTMYKNEYVPLEYAVGADEAGAEPPDYFVEQKQVTQYAQNSWCKDTLAQYPDFPWLTGQPQQMNDKCPLISGSYIGNGWSIVANSKNKEAAVAWVTWMIQPENLGLWASLGNVISATEESRKYLSAHPCLLEWEAKQAQYTVAGADFVTLWQEGKTLCGPEFQGAVLGQKSVEEALETCQREMQKVLDEQLAAV